MKKIDLTEGKVLSVLTRLAVPIMGSSILQFVYNLINMAWVGALGSNAVASIGSASFYVGLGYSINSLVVMGTGIKVSHAIGEKNDTEVKRYINSGITINLILAITFGLLLVFGGKILIGFLQLKNPIVEQEAYYYLAINSITLLFNFFNFLYTRILNSYGNNKLAFNINAIGVIVNIIFDPIFIYVFKLGVVGAALGTLAANIIMFALFLIKSNGIFKFDFNLGVDYKRVKEVIGLGLPMASQRILFTVINIMLARIISIFGTDAIAAQKVGLQIESITYMVIGGLNGAVAAFTGQNFGAKKYGRILDGYKAALKIGIVYSAVTSFIFLYFNVPIIELFIREKNTVSIASDYLIVIAFSQLFSALEMVSNGLYTGIGRPNIPSIISIVFTAIRIPMALLFIKPFGINGVWISITISSILKGVVSYLVYLISIRREYKNVRTT